MWKDKASHLGVAQVSGNIVAIDLLLAAALSGKTLPISGRCPLPTAPRLAHAVPIFLEFSTGATIAVKNLSIGGLRAVSFVIEGTLNPLI